MSVSLPKLYEQNCNADFIRLPTLLCTCSMTHIYKYIYGTALQPTLWLHPPTNPPTRALARVCVCVCVSECSFCIFFGVAKTKFHGIARGRDGKRGGRHLTRSLTSSQTKLNIKQSALYCRLTRHENMHAIG